MISGRWVPPRNGSLRTTVSPGLEVDTLDGAPDRKRHGSEMDRQVVALGDGLSRAVEHGAGEVLALLDVGRERGPAERDAHLLGDGDEEALEDLELDRVGVFPAVIASRPR